MQTHIQPPARLRSSLANAAWAVEERVVWGAGDSIRSASDAAKWPFERATWAIERGLIWPLQERLGGWDGALRAIAVGAVALVAVGIGVAGLLWVAPGNGGGSAASQAAAPTGGAIVAKPSSPSIPAKPGAPTLHGAAPVFTPPASGHAPKVAGKEAVAAPSTNSASEAGASTSSAPTAVAGQPARAAAVKVARQFSNAFVLYETGKGSAEGPRHVRRDGDARARPLAAAAAAAPAGKRQGPAGEGAEHRGGGKSSGGVLSSQRLAAAGRA